MIAIIALYVVIAGYIFVVHLSSNCAAPGKLRMFAEGAFIAIFWLPILVLLMFLELLEKIDNFFNGK